MENVISSLQAAAILKVTVTTLALWRRKKYGPQPRQKIGQAWVYDRGEVEAFAELRARVLP